MGMYLSQKQENKKKKRKKARKVTRVSHRASYNANRSAHANIYIKPRISDTRCCKYLSNTTRSFTTPPPISRRQDIRNEARDKGIRSFPVIWNVPFSRFRSLLVSKDIVNTPAVSLPLRVKPNRYTRTSSVVLRYMAYNIRVYTHTFRFELGAWALAERNATVVDDVEEEGDEEAGQEEEEEKERERRWRGGGQTGVWELAGPTCPTQTSLVSFLLACTSLPSLLSDLRARDHTGACISLRRCVWPATIRVWNSNSAAQLSESRSSGCVGWNDRGRDAWKRFILPVCALVGGLYRIERYRIGWLKGEIYDEGGCKTN